MNIKTAKKIFNEIAELSLLFENNTMNAALPSLCEDVEDADTTDEVFKITSELMFYVDEAEPVDEIKEEIQTLYNKMQDELE